MKMETLIHSVRAAFFLCCVSFQVSGTQTPAFPEAEGFGKFARGGRGGTVIEVTNLNDSGPGSLRQAIEMQGARIVIFRVSGVIQLLSDLRIENPYCTIAGQTAPGDGITLRDRTLKISTDHIIVRYIRSRLGDTAGAADAISVSRGKHIILDHCSASWSVDEVLSNQSDDVDSMTVQWCMVTESLDRSVHHKGSHGYGSIIGAMNQTYHHNLYAHHRSRSPKITWRRPVFADIRNNVIYNWMSNNCYDASDAHVNWVANYYKYGPATPEKLRRRIFHLFDLDKHDRSRPSRFYAGGNFVWGYPDVSADNWSGGIDMDQGAEEKKNRALEMFPCVPVRQQQAEQACLSVLEHAGASIVRDRIDSRIVREFTSGSCTYGRKGIIDSPNDVGGWPMHYSLPPEKDRDHDGMPDFWEKQFGLNMKNPSDNRLDPDGDGFTNIEEYLNNTDPLGSEKPIIYLTSNISRAIEETKDPGELHFRRNGGNNYPLTVSFRLHGTASSSDDFSSLPGSVTFQKGESLVRLRLIPVEDYKQEDTEFLKITLRSGKDYSIGCPGTNFIILEDSP